MHLLLPMLICLVYPVWIVNSGHQKHHQFPRYRDRHQHISRDITNLTLRFLHQKTATTITPTTSIPHSLKGLIVRNEKDIMVIELCQYLQQRRSPSWFHRYFCVRDFNPIWWHCPLSRSFSVFVLVTVFVSSIKVMLMTASSGGLSSVCTMYKGHLQCDMMVEYDTKCWNLVIFIIYESFVNFLKCVHPPLSSKLRFLIQSHIQ